LSIVSAPNNLNSNAFPPMHWLHSPMEVIETCLPVAPA